MSWLRKGNWEVKMEDCDGEEHSEWFDNFYDAIHCMKTHKDILKVGKFKIEGNIRKDRYFKAVMNNASHTSGYIVTYGLRDWRN